MYAIEIWSNVPPSLLKPLITKQKAAIRIIANKSYNAHTEPLFKALSILPLTELITHFNLKFFHSYFYNTIPPSFSSSWHTIIEHRHLIGLNNPDFNILNLRNNDDFYIPPVRTTFLTRFPLFNLPKLWNLLPQNLKEVASGKSFSFLLKKHSISLLNDIPVCNRLLCPACLRLN